MPADPRRPKNPWQTAEAVFKPAIPAAPAVSKAPVIPGAKELVSLRIDISVLEHFQSGGPGWQDRMADALRKAAGQ